MRYATVPSISTSKLCKNCHDLAQVSKYPNGHQWAALSSISTLHVKKEMKFKLSYEERRHKEDHILSNQPGPFTYHPLVVSITCH